MWSFKAYLKKEFLEAVRQYKYIMLAVGILLFSLLDPIMLKLLPNILKSQIPGDLSSLFVTTQKSAVQNYIKDLNQVGLLFVVFIISGTLCEEIYNKKLVFPYSKGASPASIVLAKFINYTAAVCLLTVTGFILNYYYVSILFNKEPLILKNIVPTIILLCVFYIFNISITIFFSSIFRKGLVSGIIVLATNIITGSLANIKFVSTFIPFKLIIVANTFSFKNSGITIIFSLALSFTLLLLAIFRMNKVEVI